MKFSSLALAAAVAAPASLVAGQALPTVTGQFEADMSTVVTTSMPGLGETSLPAVEARTIFDCPNNRQILKEAETSTAFSMLKPGEQKRYDVDAAGVCKQFWAADQIFSLDLPTGATKTGEETVDGETCDVYEFDIELLPGTPAASTVAMDISVRQAPSSDLYIPCKYTMDITQGQAPFATSISTEITFTDVTALSLNANAAQFELPADCGTLTYCDASVNFVFLLDGSGSIAAGDFEKQRDFVAGIIADFELGAGSDAKIGVVQFSATTTVESQLTNDKDALLTAVEAMTQITTSTGLVQGLDIAQDQFGDGDGTNIIVVLTDGEPDSDPEAKATEIKATGTKIMALGVGSGINLSTLRKVASPATDEWDFAQAATNFDALSSYANGIIKASCLEGQVTDYPNTCSGGDEPTTASPTPAPTPVPSPSPVPSPTPVADSCDNVLCEDDLYCLQGQCLPPTTFQCFNYDPNTGGSPTCNRDGCSISVVNRECECICPPTSLPASPSPAASPSPIPSPSPASSPLPSDAPIVPGVTPPSGGVKPEIAKQFTATMDLTIEVDMSGFPSGSGSGLFPSGSGSDMFPSGSGSGAFPSGSDMFPSGSGSAFPDFPGERTRSASAMKSALVRTAAEAAMNGDLEHLRQAGAMTMPTVRVDYYYDANNKVEAMYMQDGSDTFEIKDSFRKLKWYVEEKGDECTCAVLEEDFSNMHQLSAADYQGMETIDGSDYKHYKLDFFGIMTIEWFINDAASASASADGEVTVTKAEPRRIKISLSTSLSGMDGMPGMEDMGDMGSAAGELPETSIVMTYDFVTYKEGVDADMLDEPSDCACSSDVEVDEPKAEGSCPSNAPDGCQCAQTGDLSYCTDIDYPIQAGIDIPSTEVFVREAVNNAIWVQKATGATIEASCEIALKKFYCAEFLPRCSSAGRTLRMCKSECPSCACPLFDLCSSDLGDDDCTSVGSNVCIGNADFGPPMSNVAPMPFQISMSTIPDGGLLSDIVAADSSTTVVAGIRIPKSAFGDDVSVNVGAIDEAVAQAIKAPEGFDSLSRSEFVASTIIEVKASTTSSSSVQPEDDVELSFDVELEIVNSSSERNRYCMSYVNDDGIWECVDTSLSVEGNMVVGSTNHFSVFAITLNPETANDTNNTKKDKDGGGGGGAGAAVGIVVALLVIGGAVGGFFVWKKKQAAQQGGSSAPAQEANEAATPSPAAAPAAAAPPAANNNNNDDSSSSSSDDARPAAAAEPTPAAAPADVEISLNDDNNGGDD